MADYIIINPTSKKGKLAISDAVVKDIVENAMASFESISQNKSFKLHGPVKVSIIKDIVHVNISLDVKKGINIQEMSFAMQTEISNRITAVTDQIPFDIQIKAESII